MSTRAAGWPAFAVWAAAWAAMLALDGRLDLASLALLLVLAAAVQALWWPLPLCIAASVAAVLAFNVVFVPPRGSLTVDLHAHALLLATLMAVSGLVATLVSRQRRLAAQAQVHARRAEQLRRFGDALRAETDPLAQAARLQQALHPDAKLLLADGRVLGTPTADERAGLELAHRRAQAMGPGTGSHDEQPAWYLPLRGREACQGAAVLPSGEDPAEREHHQALCDQAGAALERSAALAAAAAAHDAAQQATLRNTLLAAIAHDHRTPLASILGSAEVLLEQGERVPPAQRQRLAATIADEARALARLTDNTLQLARLQSGRIDLQRDWESAEELVGGALARHRARGVKARVEPGLPLVHCDAALVVQALENLLDNALKHGAPPVELLARRIAGDLVLAVRDRGPGVPPSERERLFDAFRRGPAAGGRGAGIGLALGRAVAQAHGGTLRLRARGHGGSAFELVLPLTEAPPAP